MENTENKEVKEPLKNWAEVERVKPPWIKPEIKLGEHVLPPNEQVSNLDLSDKEVLQPRVEDITQSSTAKPISGRHDTGHGTTDDSSSGKKIHSA